MIFRSKKKEKEKKELLYRENIRVGCKADTQENVIREVGQMLVESGYVAVCGCHAGTGKNIFHLYGK